MDDISLPVLVPEQVFDRVKVRHLFGWMLAVFPVVIIAVAVARSPLFESLAVLAWIYGIPLLWYILRARKRGLSLRSLAGGKPTTNRWLWYPLLNIPVFLLSLGSVVLIYGLVAHFAPHFVEQVLARPESETELLTQSPVTGTMIDLAGTLILAPLFEEFMFRGFLLGRLTRKWGLTRAMVVVSVLFGLLHVNFFGAGAFSLVLCVVYVYTGSIWPSVVLHFVNNIISSWPTSGSGGQLAAADIQSAFWFGVVAVVVSVVPLVWFIKKHWPGKDAVLPYERMGKPSE